MSSESLIRRRRPRVPRSASRTSPFDKSFRKTPSSAVRLTPATNGPCPPTGDWGRAGLPPGPLTHPPFPPEVSKRVGPPFVLRHPPPLHVLGGRPLSRSPRHRSRWSGSGVECQPGGGCVWECHWRLQRGRVPPPTIAGARFNSRPGSFAPATSRDLGFARWRSRVVYVPYCTGRHRSL